MKMEEITEDISQGVAVLEHQALRGTLYHAARTRWLDGRNRIFSLIIILAGTATATDLTRGNDRAVLWLGVTIALVGALQLVCDFNGRARLHEMLQHRYRNLLTDIERDIDPTRQKCTEWTSEITRTAADEPETMRALYAIADNQATAATLGSTRPRLIVSPWRSLTRQLLPHNSSVFAIDPSWDR
jgi:hypothetical protein